MSEQLPKDPSDTPQTDAAESAWELHGRQWVRADFARQLERELTEARRSLRREENARDILAKENTRLRDQVIELRVALNVATVNQS